MSDQPLTRPDVRSWHKADLPAALTDVCLPSMSGRVAIRRPIDRRDVAFWHIATVHSAHQRFEFTSDCREGKGVEDWSKIELCKEVAGRILDRIYSRPAPAWSLKISASRT
jgi:hypothetical protein